MLMSARKTDTLLRVNRSHSLAWGLQDCVVFGPAGNSGLVNLANPQQKPALGGSHPGNWIAAPEPMIYNPNGAVADLWWNIPSAANVNYAAGSVSVFVKFIPFSWLASGAAALYGKITSGNSEICCLLGNTGNINFIYLGEVFDNTSWTTNWTLNTPSTFALSRSGVGNASLYANGKSIGTAAATGVAHETQPMELGTWAANGLGTNNGYLCFYTWVGRALTAAEVLQLQLDPYCFLQPVFEPTQKSTSSQIQAATPPFTNFDTAARPKKSAADWVAFSGSIKVEQPQYAGPWLFSPFATPSMPRNYARDWIEYNEIGYTITTRSQTGVGFFTPFDPALKPRNFAKDWTEFYDQTTANPSPTALHPFTNFDRPAKPPNFARDWVAFSGNITAEAPTFTQPFSPFGPPAKPVNSAVRNFQEFINAPGNPNQSFGSGHDWWPRAPKPPFNAIDWTAYTPSNKFFTPTPTTSTMFMSFSDGMRAKLWSKTGQQPQWWTYSFISPPSPPKPPSKRDTHDWIPKRRHKRAPPVYSQEYYDLLRKEQLERLEQKQLQLPLLIPNLLIPLDNLISPIDIPSLKIDIPSLRDAPPHRPAAELPAAVTAPVPAREPRNIEAMVHQFSAAIDKFAEAALSISEAIASEIGHDQHEFEVSRKVDEPVQAPVATRSGGVENVMQQFANAIDDLYKIGLSKNRVIYDINGRVIGVEPIPEEEE